jgi:hypothetical protein
MSLQRALTLLPLPQVCEVCDGRERMRVVFMRGHTAEHAGPDWRFGTQAPCFHCDWRIPVVHLPMREDR